MATTDGATEMVERAVAPLLESSGLRLYDVEHAGSTLRVLVDRSGGVDLDVLARLTRELSAALDDADPLPGRYTLEVSSPGLERPLRRAEHFRAALGTKVRVKLRPGTDGERRVEGTLTAADDEEVVIESEGGLRRVRVEEIERARTVFEWGPAPKRPTPSRGSGRGKAKT